MKQLIQKEMALRGIASRRESERLVKEGLVLVHGKLALPAQMVDSSDAIELRGAHTPKISVAVYKPRGVVCSSNPSEGKTVAQAFPQYGALAFVGRLDKESEGLLLLSNDGLLTRKITSDEHLVEKEYIVTVREKVLGAALARMEKGMKLRGEKTVTLPCVALKRGDHQYSIVLKEGRKHQVRRMADACNLTIESLKRIRIGNLKLGSMKIGSTRVLTEEEVSNFTRV